jgi:hypothetical protein
LSTQCISGAFQKQIALHHIYLHFRGKSIDEIKKMTEAEREAHAGKCAKDGGVKAMDVASLARDMKCPGDENTKLKRLVWIINTFDGP